MSASELVAFLSDPVGPGLTSRLEWSETLLRRVAQAFPDDARRWQVSAARVAAEVAHPAFRVDRPGDDRPMRAVDAVRKWTDCPCPKHLEAVGMALLEAADAMDGFGLLERFKPSARRARKAAKAATLAASAAVAESKERTKGQASYAVLLAVEVAGEGQVREALRGLFL